MSPLSDPLPLSLMIPVGNVFPTPIQVGAFVFVLALFVGFEIVRKVPQLLHTPLLSGANAISGITIIGALAVVGTVDGFGSNWFANLLGCLAIAFATFNVVGGFAVTDRMIRMFKSR